MIPPSFIQELLGRVDIVDVVDRHVKLKRAGANYVACCPFHSEKTPSFTVSQTKQFYHCFGCGAHGTAIGFLIEHGGLGFVEAVKELAQGAGLKVPEVRSDAAQRRGGESDDLHGVLLKAAQYYRSQLKDAPAAIAYLKRRGLSGEIAKLFGIGYAPAGWQNLAAAFSDYEGRPLAVAGLVKTSDDGRRYDMFRDRIMFPIVDVRGNVIGFGGRVLEGGDAAAAQGSPKYLNSPESPVFEKGRELYGLYQARRAVREAGRVVVVEGYMDVVALAQHGIAYAVATLGTATTPLHVAKLARQCDEIVFCFDGDNAGRRAAWRALEVSLAGLQDGKQVKFLFLPDGEDPDTYVRRHGKAEFESQLSGAAMPLSALMLRELSSRVDLTTMEGRAALLESAKPLVAQISAPFLKQAMIQEFARLGGVEARVLGERYGGGPPAQQRAAAPPRVPRYQLVTNEKTILASLIAKPELIARLDVEIEANPSDEVVSCLRDVIDVLRASPAVPSTAAVIQLLSDGGYHDLIAAATRQIAAHWGEDFDIDAEFLGAVEKIKRVQQDKLILPLLRRDPGQKWTPEEAATYSRWHQSKEAAASRPDNLLGSDRK